MTSFGELLASVEDGLCRDRLEQYAVLLERWSQRHNLVSYRSREELVRRHLLDALAGVPLLGGQSGVLADLGSGAGLPGIPLLCGACGWKGLLVEPRQKRWAFLRTVIRELGLDAEVAPCRYEDLGEDTGPFERITARAVGGYGRMLDWSRERLERGGKMLIWSTSREEHFFVGLEGWRVVSSPLPDSEVGKIIALQASFT